MSVILRKCKKVLGGCIHKNEKEADENDPILSKNNNRNNNKLKISKINELNDDLIVAAAAASASDSKYDNLQHINKKPVLKDASNTHRGLKKFMPHLNKKKIIKDNYNELYVPPNNELIIGGAIGGGVIQSNAELYSQIQHDDLFISDNEPLIDSKLNNDEENDNNNLVAMLPAQKSLTSIRELDTFSNQMDAFEWYLKQLFEIMTKSIRENKNLVDSDRAKRLNIANAHVLYAHNFYKMRTSVNLTSGPSSTSSVLPINQQHHIKLQLFKSHPCLIALACMLDSDAVRIIDAHKCECDSYVYLFNTRLKFCAWKCRFYIVLKKPNRSSIERLNLIQDLTDCHKLLQDKPVKV